MLKFRALAVLGTAFLLGGCAQAVMQSQMQQLRASCDFSGDPRFASLRGKVPLSPAENERPPSLAEVSNAATPTPAERTALLALDQATQPCAEEALRIARANLPGVTAARLQQVRIDSLRQAQLLVNAQITYGQYRANTYQIMTSALGQGDRELRSIQAQQHAQQQAATAALATTGAALLEAGRPRQVAPQPPMPTTTNCRYVGNALQCNTF